MTAVYTALAGALVVKLVNDTLGQTDETGTYCNVVSPVSNERVTVVVAPNSWNRALPAAYSRFLDQSSLSPFSLILHPDVVDERQIRKLVPAKQAVMVMQQMKTLDKLSDADTYMVCRTVDIKRGSMLRITTVLQKSRPHTRLDTTFIYPTGRQITSTHITTEPYVGTTLQMDRQGLPR